MRASELISSPHTAAYHGWSTASENVTITANATGSTQYDVIIAYIDLSGGSSTANNPDALAFKVPFVSRFTGSKV